MSDPQATAAASTPTAPEADSPTASALGVPPTLKTAAGITWRVLILLAGLAVIFFILGQIFIVVVALFLAAFFTALASPIMNFLRKRAHMHKAVAMILAIILIAVGAIVVLTVVIRSIIEEGPQLATSFQDSMSDRIAPKRGDALCENIPQQPAVIRGKASRPLTRRHFRPRARGTLQKKPPDSHVHAFPARLAEGEPVFKTREGKR